MSTQKVIIELRHSRDLADRAAMALESTEMSLDRDVVPELPGVGYDLSFPPTSIPAMVSRAQSSDPYDMSPLFELSLEAEKSTYIVRAEIELEQLDSIRKSRQVVGVYSDPVIEPTAVCPGSPPVGTDADVERLLCTSALRSINADGTGVLVAIVDTGINITYLNSRGKAPNFDAARSWVPGAGLTPGALPVGHGTMCAFDVCIAAPRATLLDVALLRSSATGPTPMSGVLSDGIRAYRHLINVMTAPRRPGEARSLVVNNSWGMFHPSWDFPPGHLGNYSDNPNHPFNRIVADLERAGADILFAAGNCGADCPDGRCQGVIANAIYGANGHSAVLCVAGVDTTKTRAGYSTTGPGRLTRQKPDISGYTHFRGSGVYTADGGTSAATPVVAGVVAAVRSKRPYDPANASTHPAAIRSLVTSTAEDLGMAGYDFLHGHGVVSGCTLARRLRGTVGGIRICERYPWICTEFPIRHLCDRYPWICRGLIELPRIPPGPGPLRGRLARLLASVPELGPEAEGQEAPDDVELAYLLGIDDGLALPRKRQLHPTATEAADCGCKGEE
jgi:hypothetical protein